MSGFVEDNVMPRSTTSDVSAMKFIMIKGDMLMMNGNTRRTVTAIMRQG